MKKWKMLKKMGLSKKEAKLAAYMIEFENSHCTLSGIAEDLQMDEEEIKKTLRDLSKCTVVLTREEPYLHQEVRLFDLSVNTEGDELPAFALVSNAFGKLVRVTDAEQEDKVEAEVCL